MAPNFRMEVGGVTLKLGAWAGREFDEPFGFSKKRKIFNSYSLCSWIGFVPDKYDRFAVPPLWTANSDSTGNARNTGAPTTKSDHGTPLAWSARQGPIARYRPLLLRKPENGGRRTGEKEDGANTRYSENP